jgi:CBS domain-containing protein
MTVRDLMRSDVRASSPDSDLGSAARIMWDHDCGIVPVQDDAKRLVGVLTDRDICIAAATKDRAPSEIRVRDVMEQHPQTCAPGDDVRRAMERMAAARVRRLPVVEGGVLRGILSLNDLVLLAESPDGRKSTEGRKSADGVTHADVVRVLKAISEHRAEATAAT